MTSELWALGLSATAISADAAIRGRTRALATPPRGPGRYYATDRVDTTRRTTVLVGKIQTESAANSGFERWNEALSLTEYARERELSRLA